MRASAALFSIADGFVPLVVAVAAVMAHRAQKAAERRYDLAVDASLDLMIALATVQQTRDINLRPFYSILTDLKLNNAIFQRLLRETPDRQSLDCQKAERLINLAITDSELRQIIVQSFDLRSSQDDMIKGWIDAASRLQAREAGPPCTPSISTQ
jgi:hypothetical protein